MSASSSEWIKSLKDGNAEVSERLACVSRATDEEIHSAVCYCRDQMTLWILGESSYLGPCTVEKVNALRERMEKEKDELTKNSTTERAETLKRYYEDVFNYANLYGSGFECGKKFPDYDYEPQQLSELMKSMKAQLDEISLECPLCLEYYGPNRKRHAMQKCGHVICGECVKKIIKNNDLEVCPFCRKEANSIPLFLR